MLKKCYSLISRFFKRRDRKTHSAEFVREKWEYVLRPFLNHFLFPSFLHSYYSSVTNELKLMPPSKFSNVLLTLKYHFDSENNLKKRRDRKKVQISQKREHVLALTVLLSIYRSECFLMTFSQHSDLSECKTFRGLTSCTKSLNTFVFFLLLLLKRFQLFEKKNYRFHRRI